MSTDHIRRAVIQRLEDLQRAGVTHWERIQPLLPTVVVPETTSVEHPVQSAASSTLSNETPSAPSAPRGEISQKQPQTNLVGKTTSTEVPKKKTIATPNPPVVRPPFQLLDLPLAERISGLAALAERVKQCTRCQELACTRTQTVFGVGNPQAKIMFIGEAPGADEDAQGEPFVGRSGQLLNDIIKACRMKREDIYICNVLRCRPPGNRLPSPEEAANCREYLEGQIAHVNPEYIVCWGACAAQNLLSMAEPIGKLRGRFHTFGRAKVLCTYHPSYLMRNPAAKKDVWEDMKRLFLDMGIDLTAKSTG